MKSILIVDDEPSYLRAQELTLSRLNYIVTTVTSAEDAFKALITATPDIIILDVMLPGMSGLECLKLLKAHPKFKRVPVIVASAARPLARQTDYGWEEFIEKPITIADLNLMIERRTQFTNSL